jgi:hypothetical protein
VVASVDGVMTGGLTPTLALVFSSVAVDFARLARDLGARGMAVAGVTTAGEIANAAVIEHSAVVMLMDPDPGTFEVSLQTVADDQPMSAIASRLGSRACARFARPIVIAFASGLRSDGEAVVRGFREGAGETVPLFGGMGGDDLRMQDSFVYSNTATSNEGIVGLVLDGDHFEVEGITTNGWQAVGVEKTVTCSKGNVVYTIDNVPALDVYRTYLNIEDDNDGRPGPSVMALGVNYPLSVRRENGTSVMRAALFYESESESLIFAGGVPQGAKVRFCIPPSLDIVERVVAEAAEVHERLPDADVLILVSCKARHMALGPLALDEVQALYDLWHTPMAGYFSYGEIGGRNPPECDFHTETCTLVALRARRG